MQRFRIVMAGGMELVVDDHEVKLIRATAEAALKGEATPLIEVMVIGAGGTSAGPMINVLQVVAIEKI